MNQQNLDAMPDKTQAICHWVKRSYSVSKEWEKKAVAIYVKTNGDSNLARIALGFELRRHFVEDEIREDELDRWNEGHTQIERVVVTPPRVTETKASYIDWLFVADYLLSCCGSPRNEIEDRNAIWQGMYRGLQRSHRMRKIVSAAIDLIERNDGIDNECVVKRLQSIDPDASLANVQEARRWLKSGSKPLPSTEVQVPQKIGLYEKARGGLRDSPANVHTPARRNQPPARRKGVRSGAA